MEKLTMNPLCAYCEKKIDKGESIYVVNPPGGYGRDGLIIHADHKCLHKSPLYQRLFDLGVLEYGDIKET